MREMIVVLAACALALAAPALAGPAAEKPAAAAAAQRVDAQARRQAMAAVKTWAIQLRHIDRAKVTASATDLVVIDHAAQPAVMRDSPFSQEEIAPLKVQPNGKRRIVLAYLSIGEAERYRYYWKPEWDNAATRPAWLGTENPHWPGDYQVKFSDPEWQSVIFGTPESYLDRIVAAGFDGVYLDRVDAYQEVTTTMPGAEDAMSGFLMRLADHARRLNPRFFIVLQNAEELAVRKQVVQRMDAIAKEDLSFGLGNTEEANPPGWVQDSVQYLRRAQRAGLKVLVLEYVTDTHKTETARALAAREGYVLHLTERMLGTLNAGGTQEPPAPAAARQ